MKNSIFIPQILQLKERDALIVTKGHPWLFADVLTSEAKSWGQGQIIELQNQKRERIAYGLYERDSKLAIRVMSTTALPSLPFFIEGFKKCADKRIPLLKRTNAIRFCHGENDGLPGITVDSYAGYLVVVFDGKFLTDWESIIVEALVTVFNPKGILRRFQGKVSKEGSAEVVPKVVAGEVPTEIIINENGINYSIDPFKGAKSGFFVDQRDSRYYVRKVSKKSSVLNCFSYTGGFGLNAALGGAARVLNVDISKQAIAVAKTNLSLNRDLLASSTSTTDFLVADVMEFLKTTNEKFDLIILDPPSFTSGKESVQNALNAYLQLHKLALPLLRPGGHLFSCSCSRRISLKDFKLQIEQAAHSMRVKIKIIESLAQPLDHPTRKSFPEGKYLKNLYIEVLNFK